MSVYKIAEIFTSINGEGQKAGEAAVFVRFVGCNLRCSYCDTLWALDSNAEYTAMTEEEICDYVRNSGISNVTLTGGEPLIQPEIDNLISALLKDEDIRIEIETNGAVDIRPFIKRGYERLSFTVDYKCSGSGMKDRMYLKNYDTMRKNDTVKFVVGDRRDLNEMRSVVTEYDLIKKTAVYVSPVFGKIDAVEIVKFMLNYKMNGIKLQLQMHKYIWDPDTKGV